MPRRIAIGLLTVFFAVGPLRGALPVEETEPPESAQGSAQSPFVAAIEIRSDAPLNGEKEFEGLLEIAVGKPLTDAVVRRTLRNIQASGRGTEVEIYTEPAPAGEYPGAAGAVVVILVLRTAVQVDSVSVDGELGLPRSDLYDALPQRTAQPLSEEQILAGVYNLEKLYEARGYFEAKVQLHVHTNPVTRRAAVLYHLVSGPQAT
ncbi:MAG TPA: POTRA domain-containing protein, partial [Thermoanaerobaculia bacterium]|nr:POTRA domain-containing protein [Thermoanaerobaculia bacterium]